MTSSRSPSSWPSLPEPDAWLEAYETLHLWSQIVGKVKMSETPLINHWWNVALFVGPDGLTTGSIPTDRGAFELRLDVHRERLVLLTSEGRTDGFDLNDQSVQSFYEELTGLLEAHRIETRIWPMPVEVPDPITPFTEDDAHAAYDAATTRALWQALLEIDRTFTAFRARFLGKVSPVNFYWGAFDLAVTRFSGREAPLHPGGVPNCADWVMHEAYSHEVSSAGFWPGAGLGEAAFYSYAYPEPDGYREATVEVDGAYFDENLGEFVLPYERVRSSDAPGEHLMRFLQSTYEAAADLGNWDRDRLERSTDYRPDH